MVWGWMPCGFVYAVVVMATLQADAWYGALTMVAFGLGTTPAMFAASLGAGRAAAFAARPAARRIAVALLVASAMLTLIAPWLPPPLHHGLHG